jgi:hypothetical protein
VAESRSQTKGWDSIGRPFARENARSVVLSISPYDEAPESLKGIFRSDWTVIVSSSVTSAISVLREIPIPIVFCDCGISSGWWSEMLDQISLLPDPHSSS